MNKVRKKVVIVGAGTAGLVIAKNLQSNFDVTVIEKSFYKSYPVKYRVPLLIGIVFRKKGLQYLNKRFQVSDDGRQIPWFESNVFGGSSVINGCVHMFGSMRQWSKILKKFDIKSEELLKSYKKTFSTTKRKNTIKLSLSYQSLIDKAFISTLNSFGIPKSDTNYSDNEGCGPIYNTVGVFFRSSVISLLNKIKFKYYTNECVKELIFDGKKIVGVKTDKRTIKSDYVILSGGVAGTCELLIREKNRQIEANNPIFNDFSFGKKIKDHTNLRVNITANKKIGSLNEISASYIQQFFLVLKHYFGIRSFMRGTGATSAVHLDLDKDGVIDTRVQIVQFSETGRHGSDGKFFSTHEPGFSLSITAINPKSRGEIKVDAKGNSINPKFLSERSDIDLLKLSLKFCLELLKSKPISQHILNIDKEKEIISKPEEYIRNNIYSGHHLIGGAQDAINSNFQLKGLKGIYICDASVFDSYAASNIHSSVVLLADNFSKKFIQNYNQKFKE